MALVQKVKARCSALGTDPSRRFHGIWKTANDPTAQSKAYVVGFFPSDAPLAAEYLWYVKGDLIGSLNGTTKGLTGIRYVDDFSPPLTAITPFQATNILTGRSVDLGTSPTPLTSGTVPKVGPLSKDDSCTEYDNIAWDYTLDDEQSASKFKALAKRTSDPHLAAAIRETARMFEMHAQEISPDAVHNQCP